MRMTACLKDSKKSGGSLPTPAKSRLTKGNGLFPSVMNAKNDSKMMVNYNVMLRLRLAINEKLLSFKSDAIVYQPEGKSEGKVGWVLVLCRRRRRVIRLRIRRRRKE